MAVYLLLKDDDSVILAFGQGSPDLLVSESHENTVTITNHPVEKGAAISDHIRVENKAFSFEAFVTNTPIVRDTVQGRGDVQGVQVDFPKYRAPFDGTPGAVFRKIRELGEFAVDQITGAQPPTTTREIQVLVFPETFDRVREVQDQLTAYQDAGALWTVITASRTYEDMVIVKVGLPRDQPGGATFNVDLRTIRTVETATVKAPKPLEKRGAPKAAKGSQGTKTPPVDPKPTSLVAKGLKLLTRT